MTEPVWLSRQIAEAVHERQLAQHGGSTGLRDAGVLESALARPVSAWGYGEADPCELAALLADGIARNHLIADGTKRTVFVMATLIPRVDGLRLIASNTEAAFMTAGLAPGGLPREGFAMWLCCRTIAA